MSKAIIERKQIRCSNAELAAMYLNNEISTQQYFDALEPTDVPIEGIKFEGVV